MSGYGSRCDGMSSNSVDIIDFDVLGPMVRRALSGLRFGSVEIVVHDSRVVQIERREKVRLDMVGDRLPDRRRRVQQLHARADRSAGGSELARAGETIE